MLNDSLRRFLHQTMIVLFTTITVIVTEVAVLAEIPYEIQRLLDSAQYYSLRDPSRTLSYSKHILERLPERGNENAYIDALMHCANSEKMFRNPELALRYCDHAIRIATRLRDNDLLIRTYFMKASVFASLEQLDSALIYHQHVIALDYPDANRYFISNAYTNVGLTYLDIGNSVKAEEYLLNGFRKSGKSERTKMFTLMPLIQFYIGQGDRQYLLYLDTLSSFDAYQDASQPMIMNHFEAGLFPATLSAEEKEQRLRELCKYYQVHNSPRMQIHFGLQLAGHLSETQKLYEADTLLQSLLIVARSSGSLLNESAVLEGLYTVSKTQGNLEEALSHVEAYLTAFQKHMTERNTNEINELNIRFESVQKDHEIEAQRVRLEQQARRRNYLIAVLSLTIALSFLTYLYFRNRIRSVRKIAEQASIIHNQEIARLHKEKEFAELTAELKTKEKERNRIARDLHDEIGSTLSSIHVYSSAATKAIQTSPDVTQEILEKIKASAREVMENMSDIIWAINPESHAEMTLGHKLKNYGYEFLTPQGISCTYQIDADLEKRLMNVEARKNILLMSKEAMNNMAKHSGATEASITFERIGDMLQLSISDNGNGISAPGGTHGNGLKNMRRRTEALGGSFRIETAQGNGTRIFCQIPITSIRDAWTEDHA